MSKHYNIPIFVPHLGCPHDCAFCNQKRITGVSGETTPQQVIQTIETHLSTIAGGFIEVAFFGGSFTGIPQSQQNELLEAVQPYLNDGRVHGIRLSTRPDYINSEILQNLKNYGVTAIELGVQSMDDAVLQRNKRGHTSADVVNATSQIRSFNFELGHQMMTGMYGSTSQKDIDTAREIIALKPDTIRIYPTMVLKSTELELLYLQGKYAPPTLEQTVALCKTLVLLFEVAEIKIIRLGLQATETMHTDIAAGAYHSAFGQLVECSIMLEIMEEKLKAVSFHDKIQILVSPKKISPAIGDKKANIECLKQKYRLNRLTIRADGSLTGREVKILE